MPLAKLYQPIVEIYKHLHRSYFEPCHIRLNRSKKDYRYCKLSLRMDGAQLVTKELLATEIVRKISSCVCKEDVIKKLKLLHPDCIRYTSPSVKLLHEFKDENNLTGKRISEITLVSESTVRSWLRGKKICPPAAWKLLQIETGELK